MPKILIPNGHQILPIHFCDFALIVDSLGIHLRLSVTFSFSNYYLLSLAQTLQSSAASQIADDFDDEWTDDDNENDVSL